MSKIATRIQSRLTRKGIKITLGEIKDALTQTAIDADNPTDDEIDATTQYFINQASMPVVVNEEEIFLEESEEEEAIAPNLEMVDEAIAPVQEQRSQIIKSQSQALGIILDDAEIIQIASNLDNSSNEFYNSLDEIKSAIISFVRHKASLNAQKIDNVVDEINSVVAEEFSNNSQQLSQGLQAINANMQQQDLDFKSKVKAAISAFNISAKAG